MALAGTNNYGAGKIHAVEADGRMGHTGEEKHQEEKHQPGDVAEIAVRPPVLFLAGLLAGSLLELIAPLGPGLAGGTLRPIGFGLGIVALGLALGWRAIARFISAGTTVSLSEPTETLVTGGLYAISRNPIYIGLIIAYFGLALALTSGWALILLPVLVTVLQKGVVLREETFLERKFGPDYLAYKEKVPRWL